jgi:hypothetical protein
MHSYQIFLTQLRSDSAVGTTIDLLNPRVIEILSPGSDPMNPEYVQNEHSVE